MVHSRFIAFLSVIAFIGNAFAGQYEKPFPGEYAPLDWFIKGYFDDQGILASKPLVTSPVRWFMDGFKTQYNEPMDRFIKGSCVDSKNFWQNATDDLLHPKVASSPVEIPKIVPPIASSNSSGSYFSSSFIAKTMVAVALTAAVVKFAAKKIRMRWDLNGLAQQVKEWGVGKSSEVFPLAYWASYASTWSYASNVNTNKVAYLKALNSALKNGHEILGRYAGKAVLKNDGEVDFKKLKQLVQTECEDLKKELLRVGSYSDAPREVYLIVNNKKSEIADETTEQKTLVPIADAELYSNEGYLSASTRSTEVSKIDKALMTRIHKELQRYCDSFTYSEVLFRPAYSWHNPTKWVVAPWATKMAITLYGQLFEAYARLLVIQQIIDEEAAKYNPLEDLKNDLRNFKSSVDWLMKNDFIINGSLNGEWLHAFIANQQKITALKLVHPGHRATWDNIDDCMNRIYKQVLTTKDKNLIQGDFSRIQQDSEALLNKLS